MRHIRKRIIRSAATCLVTVFCIVTLVAILPQPARTAEPSSDQTQKKQARDTGNPLIILGQYPPDFELPKLTFSTDMDGNPVGIISEKDTIRLSSFRGKKPVCLIMSSYT